MSDISRNFKPWEDNFTKGLYLESDVVDYNCPKENGQLYLFFPIRSI
ncbi:hypothetical protein [Clostridium akagii]|nr:hypothetical protein [Clostridium akagii]